MMTFTITGPMNTTTNATTSLHIITDQATSDSLHQDLESRCQTRTNLTEMESTSNNLTLLRPETIIQYYRASSVALSLDGYNNTAAFSGHENDTDAPLPSWVDSTFLQCVNATIGEAVPLVAASQSSSTSSFPNGANGLAGPELGFSSLVGLIWMVWYIGRATL